MGPDCIHWLLQGCILHACALDAASALHLMPASRVAAACTASQWLCAEVQHMVRSCISTFRVVSVCTAVFGTRTIAGALGTSNPHPSMWLGAGSAARSGASCSSEPWKCATCSRRWLTSPAAALHNCRSAHISRGLSQPMSLWQGLQVGHCIIICSCCLLVRALQQRQSKNEICHLSSLPIGC